MTFKTLLTLPIFFFICHNGFSQSSKEILASEVSTIINEESKNRNILGGSIAIIYNDEVIYNKGFGHKDAQKTKPVTNKTLFAMGSTTKAFTGALCAKAHEEEVIKLDSTVSSQYPIKFFNDNLNQNITFLDMLTHRTGVPGHDLIWLTQPIDRDELISRIEYYPTNASLRELFQYNNTFFAIPGIIVSRLQNTTWEDLTSKTLYYPLEMTSTNTKIEVTKASGDYSDGFIHNGNSFIPLPFRNLELIAPAGGVYTNATDLSKWVMMLLNNGVYKEKEVLSKAIIDRMFTPYVVSTFSKKFEEEDYVDYGLGWMISTYRGLLHVFHGGNIDGYTAGVDLFPDKDLGIIMLTNTAAANDFIDVVKYRIVDYLFQFPETDWNSKFNQYRKTKAKSTVSPQSKKEEIPFFNPDAKFLESLEGLYYHQAYGIMEVKLKDGKLTANYGNMPLEFTAKDKDTFTENTSLGGQEFHFTFDKNMKVTELKSTFYASGQDIVFKKIK